MFEAWFRNQKHIRDDAVKICVFCCMFMFIILFDPLFLLCMSIYVLELCMPTSLQNQSLVELDLTVVLMLSCSPSPRFPAVACELLTELDLAGVSQPS